MTEAKRHAIATAIATAIIINMRLSLSEAENGLI
jgi:hypothetical protein